MAKKAKRSGSKPRPKLTALRKEMKRLSGDLTVIIRDKKDQQGDLTQKQLARAKKIKKVLDVALAKGDCVQSQGAY